MVVPPRWARLVGPDDHRPKLPAAVGVLACLAASAVALAATTMGFAFAFGVAAVGWGIWRDAGRWRWRDVTAVAAAVVFPLAMVGFGGYAGLLQRPIFVVAYLWYGAEALRLLRGPSRSDIQSSDA